MMSLYVKIRHIVPIVLALELELSSQPVHVLTQVRGIIPPSRWKIRKVPWNPFVLWKNGFDGSDDGTGILTRHHRSGIWTRSAKTHVANMIPTF
jgi:hypothetical protein